MRLAVSAGMGKIMNQLNTITSTIYQRFIIIYAYSHQFFIWMLDGIGAILPERFKDRYWRPYIRKTSIDDGSSLIIERSLFGNRREDNKYGLPHLTPVIERLVIGDNDIFITRLILPQATRKKLNRTIALRLGELSPLPPDETAFACNITGKTKDKRLLVRVAMMRKSQLEGSTQCLTGNPDRIELTYPLTNEPEFIFNKYINPHKKLDNGRSLRCLAVAASIGVFLMGINIFLANQQSAMKLHEQDLIIAIKAEKKSQKILTTIRDDRNTLKPTLKPKDALYALFELEQNLPEKSFLQRLTIEADGINANGYLPAATINNISNDNLVITTTPSKRPDIMDANFILKPETSHDE